MNTITVRDQEKEIERIVGGLDENEREHLRSVLYDLVQCYETGSNNCAVLILGNKEHVSNVLTLGCNTMVAAVLLGAANDFIGYLNTADAPPKEMFN